MNRLRLMPAGIIPVLAASFSACGDSPAAEDPASEVEQYNEVRWASTLDDADRTEVAVREMLFPPAWRAPEHYHNSDLFIYVLEGQFEVRGDRHPITLTFEGSREGTAARVEARFAVPWVAWGLPDPGNFLLSVDKSLDVVVESRGVLSPVAEP